MQPECGKQHIKRGRRIEIIDPSGSCFELLHPSLIHKERGSYYTFCKIINLDDHKTDRDVN